MTTFLKMHGLGNDFVILDARTGDLAMTADRARQIADRHFGVGCDQLIVIEPSAKATAFMRIYNPDGSEAGACGNATRCVASLLDGDAPVIETISGLLPCVKNADGTVTVDMGEPKLDWEQIPLSNMTDTLRVQVGVGAVKEPTCVNMGNPHAVFFVPDAAAVPLTQIGPSLETASVFPERANIEVVQVLDRAHVRARVWERGAGITLACGSGACAVAVAGVRRGLTDRSVTVTMDGGDLKLEWREADNHVYMTGPVATSFEGVLKS